MTTSIRRFAYIFAAFPPIAKCFQSRCVGNQNSYHSSSASFTRQHRIASYSSESDFVDVEFERSSPEVRGENGNIGLSSEDESTQDDMSALLGTRKNLIDISLETGDPKWKETRIPFCRGTEYIDCQLAFMVDLEGQSYGIGVPFDDVVAIVVQDKKKNRSNNDNIETKNINPDAYSEDEEYAELMEIFAVQVQEQFGEEYKLRKTPKVLTISGGLDKITKDWQNKVMTKPFDIDDLVQIAEPKNEDDLSNELDLFYKFMRDELGDEEFEMTMNGNDKTELNELMGLFDVPMIEGDDEKVIEDLDELMQSISKDIDSGEVSEAKEFIQDTDNTALKLLGYTFRESGKSYFLVKPLQPYTLVGRYMEDEKEMIRFELLSSEEEKVIIPKLEQICQEDLKANGLSISSSNSGDMTGRI